ncbi:MAG: transcriptional regulator [Frankia sp.]
MAEPTVPSDIRRASNGGSAERRAWIAVRRHLIANRHDLTRMAARLYPSVPAVAGTRLLARPGWILNRPRPLDDVALIWEPDPLPPVVDGTGPASLPLRPRAAAGGRFASYADVLGALDRPAMFDDRTCYRLLDVLPGIGVAPRLVFGAGHYFDGINTGEALAHEFAAATMPGPPSSVGTKPPPESEPALPPMRSLELRRRIGDPCDAGRRAMLPAISVLTVRHDRRTGDARMLLHWRDPARVAANNGLFQVVPVGVFQPSAEGRWNLLSDFDVERSIVREMSEELLGVSEDHGTARAALDYETWPFYRDWREARARDGLTLSWLGLGVDPLTLSTDLLAVAVFDAEVFDQMFPRLVHHNQEGEVVGAAFTAANVLRYSTVEPMQPAGAALLRLAWKHRGELLGYTSA